MCTSLYQTQIGSIGLQQACVSPVATHTIGTNQCVHGQQFASAQPIVLHEHLFIILQYCLVQPNRAKQTVAQSTRAKKQPILAKQSLVQYSTAQYAQVQPRPAWWENSRGGTRLYQDGLSWARIDYVYQILLDSIRLHQAELDSCQQCRSSHHFD